MRKRKCEIGREKEGKKKITRSGKGAKEDGGCRMCVQSGDKGDVSFGGLGWRLRILKIHASSLEQRIKSKNSLRRRTLLDSTVSGYTGLENCYEGPSKDHPLTIIFNAAFERIWYVEFTVL